MPPTNNPDVWTDPAVNNVWASNAPSTVGEVRTLPSGQTCRARRLQIEDLVDMGILEQADSLTSIVDAKHVRKVRGGKGADRDEVNLASVIKDPGALRSMITLADKAMPVIVLDPPVALHYLVQIQDGVETSGKPIRHQRMLTPDERAKLSAERPGLVFTDQIDLADKMELFNWAMGSMGGLESFRGDETTTPVAAVADGAGIPVKTKRTRGAKSR